MGALRILRLALAAKIIAAALLAPAEAAAASSSVMTGWRHDFPCWTGGALGCEVAGLHSGLPLALPQLGRVVLSRSAQGLGLAPRGGAALVPALLALPEIFAGGFGVPPNGGAAGAFVGDTYTPQNGTFTVAGAFTATGAVTGSGVIWGNGSQNGQLTYAGGGKLLMSVQAGSDFFAFQPNVSDASGNIAFLFNNVASLTATSKALADFQNNGVDEVLVRPTSGLAFFNTVAPAAADIGIGASGSALNLQVPTGDTIQLQVNQVNFGRLMATAAAETNENGQLEFSHAAGASGAPTSATAGTGCGTSSAPTVTGNDYMGQIGVTCGSAGTAGNNFVSATFAHAYVTNAPVCVVTPANAATSAGFIVGEHLNNSTTTTLAVSCGGGTCTTGTLLWNYSCSQR